MPRRKLFSERKIESDPIFHNLIIGRFINGLLRKGKKSLAQEIFYSSFDIIKERTKKEPEEVFKKAIENVKPFLEVKSRRVGGATYQVPVEVREKKGIGLAIRWIIQTAKQRKGAPMAWRLALELIDASNNTGGAVKKKEDIHKMAEANRAFAHYRW
ncbi:30S ribosomal protein S7 [Candidatus Desantisbacteria bacterium CG1_02_38_46]|uniref:Small ribosomal subunit protein uS7 n=3 Tax=unclassified Candidatus Desantisiibacteriota TaxID=3106372 RepID=A0A2H9PCG3_9BACT|nr:MAG: 30S ribosomal protein S7 [Candidatus Desantisbacteria bacterium CG1_02_38_46]PIU51312.1 MAG: 30S ribosomal protein S7 [Candidatus Desantisbacteria bacterium CG07_land_8_20_14_0_80_39_15]PIZ16936.1 MAG: 30S ribosomal protein S7 [Candidatus Desantisbacteria bacterium CG_4_10_14_0_8_um_filter_39_17]